MLSDGTAKKMVATIDDTQPLPSAECSPHETLDPSAKRQTLPGSGEIVVQGGTAFMVLKPKTIAGQFTSFGRKDLKSKRDSLQSRMGPSPTPKNLQQMPLASYN